MVADFAKLPHDLLSLALSKLSTPDYTRFGAVCQTWRQAFLERDHPPVSQIPWMILPGNDKRTLIFLSETNELYEIRQPDPIIRRRLYIGSSDGWLFTVSDSTLDMHLLNPITGIQILLPSITTFSSVKAIYHSNGCISKYVISEQGVNPYYQSPDSTRCMFFEKAVFFKTARDMKDGFIVMLIHLPTNKLAFTRSGDNTWTTLNGRKGIQDVIRYRGQIYTVASKGIVDVWDPDGQSFKPRTITRETFGEEDLVGYNEYLVESITGNLLWVRRDLQYDGLFKVFKLDESTSEWAEIKDLGEQALFVGNNRSMALSVQENPELKRSCIYFTDDVLWLSERCRRHRRNVGTYDLADDKTYEHVHLFRTWPPPIRLTPLFS